MSLPLSGYSRVVEVASWVMAPSAGSVLAEWGADVLKVEHPSKAESSAGPAEHGATIGSETPMNVSFHQANRDERLDRHRPRRERWPRAPDENRG